MFGYALSATDTDPSLRRCEAIPSASRFRRRRAIPPETDAPAILRDSCSGCSVTRLLSYSIAQQPRDRATQQLSLQRRQLRPLLEHRLEQIAHFGEAVGHRPHIEFLRVELLVDLFPLQGRRHRRAVDRAQRIRCDHGLAVAVLQTIEVEAPAAPRDR